jgi:hypothetical protein
MNPACARVTPDEATPQTDKMCVRENLAQTDQVSSLKPSSPIHGAPFRSTVIHHRAVRVDHRAGGSPCGWITGHRADRYPTTAGSPGDESPGYVTPPDESGLRTRVTPDEATPQTDKMCVRENLAQIDQVSSFKPSSPIHGAPFRSTVIHHRAVDHRWITGQIDTQPPPVRQGMNPLAT